MDKQNEQKRPCEIEADNVQAAYYEARDFLRRNKDDHIVVEVSISRTEFLTIAFHGAAGKLLEQAFNQNGALKDYPKKSGYMIKQAMMLAGSRFAFTNIHGCVMRDARWGSLPPTTTFIHINPP